MSEQLVLGLDPGAVLLGYCLARFTGQRRDVINSGSVGDIDAGKAVRWLRAYLDQTHPHLISIEGYDFQGQERSGNSNAFAISRLVGDIEGACLMWSELRQEGLVQVVRVRKVDANRTIGLVGKTSKARVRRAIEALFPFYKFRNEHECDAAVVCMAGRHRRAA
jgi:Holliday junction resolvasome RuvABC endonuclease subunit